MGVVHEIQTDSIIPPVGGAFNVNVPMLFQSHRITPATCGKLRASRSLRR